MLSASSSGRCRATPSPLTATDDLSRHAGPVARIPDFSRPCPRSTRLLIRMLRCSPSSLSARAAGSISAADRRVGAVTTRTGSSPRTPGTTWRRVRRTARLQHIWSMSVQASSSWACAHRAVQRGAAQALRQAPGLHRHRARRAVPRQARRPRSGCTVVLLGGDAPRRRPAVQLLRHLLARLEPLAGGLLAIWMPRTRVPNWLATPSA